MPPKDGQLKNRHYDESTGLGKGLGQREVTSLREGMQAQQLISSSLGKTVEYQERHYSWLGHSLGGG